MGDLSHRHGKKLSSRSGARELLFTKSRPGQSRRNSNRRELSHLIQPSHCPLPENSWSAVACHRFSAVNSATQTIGSKPREFTTQPRATRAPLPPRAHPCYDFLLSQAIRRTQLCRYTNTSARNAQTNTRKSKVIRPRKPRSARNAAAKPNARCLRRVSSSKVQAGT